MGSKTPLISEAKMFEFKTFVQYHVKSQFIHEKKKKTLKNFGKNKLGNNELTHLITIITFPFEAFANLPLKLHTSSYNVISSSWFGILPFRSSNLIDNVSHLKLTGV